MKIEMASNSVVHTFYNNHQDYIINPLYIQRENAVG